MLFQKKRVIYHLLRNLRNLILEADNKMVVGREMYQGKVCKTKICKSNSTRSRCSPIHLPKQNMCFLQKDTAWKNHVNQTSVFLFPSPKFRSTKNYLPPQVHQVKLVGGFNPFEKYWSKWESSPGRDEHKQYLQPPTSLTCVPLTF